MQYTGIKEWVNSLVIFASNSKKAKMTTFFQSKHTHVFEINRIM